MKTPLALMIMASLATPVTAGNLLLVPEDYTTIQDAMDSASPGDVIDLASGIWTNQIVWGLSGVTLRGRNGDGSTIIDGSEHDWSPIVCYGEPSTIEHITFRNGVGSNVFGIVRGGAIYAEFVQVTIADCVFESNSVTAGDFDFEGVGGAVCGYYAPLIIDRCTFIDNYSDNAGGAIYATHAESLQVRNCEFMDNFAGWSGGGISSEWTPLLIEDCLFKGNYAAALGGGIYSTTSEDAKVGPLSQVWNCTFKRNNASWFGYGMGGGISIEHAQIMNVADCSFEDNYGYIAGAIMGGDATGMVRLFDSHFCGNALSDNWGEVIDDGSSSYEQSCGCSVDADGDGSVNVNDLLLVISNWGSFNPDADVDNDGMIGVNDLLSVISAWGNDCS